MNLTGGRFKDWWRRQLQPTPRSGKLLGYIFAWLMATGAIRIAFFRYENFWVNLVSILFWLMIGDFIGSKTYPSFRRFALRIRSSRN